MALTKDFRDTIRERAQREVGFRQGLLREGLELICDGKFATGRAILRNYSRRRTTEILGQNRPRMTPR
jgi:RNase P protein component